jgi:trk system potassium uptake protein TrkA
VAYLLSQGQHNIVIIDRDSSAFGLLEPTFNGVTVLGNGIDVDVQRSAGVDRADAFIAVTGNDATNLMAAQVARGVYHVPKVVARVSDSENEGLYRHFGIQTISPLRREAKEICQLISTDAVERYLVLEAAKVELVRARVKPWAVGKTVGQLSRPGQLLVSMIIRCDNALIPEHDTLIEAKDEVIVTMTNDCWRKQRKWLEI